MNVCKAVVHTDVLFEHLCGKREPSVLRLALQKFFCYTTVFQAIELFSLGKSGRELQAISDVMAAVKVLGLNAKNARRYGELVRKKGRNDRWNILIAGLCLESRLPIITGRGRDFWGIPGLAIIPSQMIAELATGDEILGALKRADRRVPVDKISAG